MSEPLGEAFVVVRPDTRGFGAELQAQLTAATRGLKVGVPALAAAAIGCVAR
jgi:hypothetical protein